ncbi:MAG: tetratricopeptide repeat protein [Anaerolineales bacterium]|nr:tetratricopeptide repeat protein [Anaerolineales bacterium]
MRFTKIFFIVLGLLVLFVSAIIINGYNELAQAEGQSQGVPQIAAQHYERAARCLIWRVDFWEKAGASAYAGKNYAEAIRLFSIARDHASLSAEAWDIFGSAYWLDDDHDTALDVWQNGAGEYPSNAALYDRLTMAYHASGDYVSEQEALTARISLGADAQAYYRLSLLLIFSDSKRALDSLTATSSLDTEFDSVSQTLITAINLSAIQPDEATRLVTLGRGLGLVDEWNLASRAFDEAIRADAKNAEAWAWLGEAKQQKSEDGRAELDRALELNPGSVLVRGLRGLYWKRQGYYRQALSEYLFAAESEPENPAWRVSIAEAYAQMGDLVSALAAYQRATELAPKESIYWRLLALFCAANNIQVEEVGLPAAQKAVQLAPKDASALDVLGWSYLLSGRLTLAEQTLLKAVNIAPELASAHLHLGMTYLAQANRNAAHLELTRARDLDPQGEVGQFAAQLLKQYFP